MSAKNKIQIDKDDYVILQKILNKYPYKFYVYGSRARGYAGQYSDIDIFCKEKINSSDLVDINTRFEESNITVKVDLLDAKSCNKAFYKTIEKDLIELE